MALNKPPANLFAGMKSAKPILDSEYFKPGHYWVLNCRNKIDQNRKLEWFIANEFTIIHVLDNAGGQGFSIGASATHLVMQKSDYFASEVRTFVSKVLAVAFEDVGEEEAMSVYGDDQPLAGTIIEVRATMVMTKKNTPFTKICYMREVPASEALGVLAPEVVARFFPAGKLQALAEKQKT
jgi:hypothetical protein